MDQFPLSPAASWDSNTLDEDALEDLESELYAQLHYSQIDGADQSLEVSKVTQVSRVVTESTSSLQGSHSNSLSFDEGSSSKKSCATHTGGKKVEEDEVEDSRYTAIRENLKKPRIVVLETPSSSHESSDSDTSVVFLGGSNIRSPKSNYVDLALSDDESEDDVGDPVLECSSMQLNISQVSNCSKLSDVTGGKKPLSEEDYSRFICRKWTTDMISYYEHGKLDKDVEEIQKSFSSNAKWTVDIEDKWSLGNSRNSRYFNKRKIRCNNCNQWDHVARHCPDPVRQIKCHMCGSVGHEEPRCPNKICLGCGAVNRIYSESCPSCQSYTTATCSICNHRGHVQDLCPDLWRRYHLTVTNSAPQRPAANSVFMKPASDIFCCNCAQRGHLPVHCTKLKSSLYPPSTPVVYDYTDIRQVTNLGSFTGDQENNYINAEGPSRKQPGERSLKYSFLCGEKCTESRIRELIQMIEANVNNVRVNWRRQNKKKRIFVEFVGHGNLNMARDFFKKHLHRSGNLQPKTAGDFGKLVFSVHYMKKTGELKEVAVKFSVDEKTKSDINHTIRKIEKSCNLSISADYSRKKCNIYIEKIHNSHAAYKKLWTFLLDLKKQRDSRCS